MWAIAAIVIGPTVRAFFVLEAGRTPHGWLPLAPFRPKLPCFGSFSNELCAKLAEHRRALEATQERCSRVPDANRRRQCKTPLHYEGGKENGTARAPSSW